MYSLPSSFPASQTSDGVEIPNSFKCLDLNSLVPNNPLINSQQQSSSNANVFKMNELGKDVSAAQFQRMVQQKLLLQNGKNLVNQKPNNDVMNLHNFMQELSKNELNIGKTNLPAAQTNFNMDMDISQLYSTNSKFSSHEKRKFTQDISDFMVVEVLKRKELLVENNTSRDLKFSDSKRRAWLEVRTLLINRFPGFDMGIENIKSHWRYRKRKVTDAFNEIRGGDVDEKMRHKLSGNKADLQIYEDLKASSMLERCTALFERSMAEQTSTSSIIDEFALNGHQLEKAPSSHSSSTVYSGEETTSSSGASLNGANPFNLPKFPSPFAAIFGQNPALMFGLAQQNGEGTTLAQGNNGQLGNNAASVYNGNQQPVVISPESSSCSSSIAPQTNSISPATIQSFLKALQQNQLQQNQLQATMGFSSENNSNGSNSEISSNVGTPNGLISAENTIADHVELCNGDLEKQRAKKRKMDSPNGGFLQQEQLEMNQEEEKEAKQEFNEVEEIDVESVEKNALDMELEKKVEKMKLEMEKKMEQKMEQIKQEMKLELMENLIAKLTNIDLNSEKDEKLGQSVENNNMDMQQNEEKEQMQLDNNKDLSIRVKGNNTKIVLNDAEGFLLDGQPMNALNMCENKESQQTGKPSKLMSRKVDIQVESNGTEILLGSASRAAAAHEQHMAEMQELQRKLMQEQLKVYENINRAFSLMQPFLERGSIAPKEFKE